MNKLILILSILAGTSFGANVFFGSPSYATVTSTSTQILPQNSLRSYLLIINTGSNAMYANFGAPGSGSGILIPAGWNYEPNETPANSVYLSSPSGTTATLIQGQ